MTRDELQGLFETKQRLHREYLDAASCKDSSVEHGIACRLAMKKSIAADREYETALDGFVNGDVT